MLLQYGPSTKLSKGIYKNISRSRLYREEAQTPVLLCPGMIEWMAWRIDHESETILNFRGKHLHSYHAPMLYQMYHFKEAQFKVTPKWLQSKTESIEFLTIIKRWW